MSESNPRFTAADASAPDVRVTANAGTIRTMVEVLGALVDECRIRFGEDGIHVSATDPAVVASVTLTVESSTFEEYVGTDDVFGIDLERLENLLRIADREQPVSFVLDAETRNLHLAVEELEYTMALIDPASIRSPPDPSALNFEYDGGAVVKTEDVDRFVRATDMVADHLAIGMTEADDLLYVEAEGDTDDVFLSFSESDLVDSPSGDIRSLFSLSYLRSMSRAIPNDRKVQLRLGTDLPISLRFDLAEGDGSVEYVLSPRIASS